MRVVLDLEFMFGDPKHVTGVHPFPHALHDTLVVDLDAIAAFQVLYEPVTLVDF